MIGIASTLITAERHLSSGRLALLNSTMLAAAFLGPLGPALAPSYWVLVAFRFVLGFGVGGDYPVSAMLMSEYADRKDRGKLVGMGVQHPGAGAGSSARSPWRWSTATEVVFSAIPPISAACSCQPRTSPQNPNAPE